MENKLGWDDTVDEESISEAFVAVKAGLEESLTQTLEVRMGRLGTDYRSMLDRVKWPV